MLGLSLDTRCQYVCIFYPSLLCFLQLTSWSRASPIHEVLPQQLNSEQSSTILPTLAARSIDDTNAGNNQNEANRVETVLKEQTEEEHAIAKLFEQDLFTGSTPVCDEKTAPGRSQIYCHGRLLQAVMAVKLHDDSKTFLDRPIKANRTGKMVAEEFDKRFPQKISDLKFAEVKEFVDEHFDLEGLELDICQLSDWAPAPPLLYSIKDPKYRNFAQTLNAIWIQLCRQVNPIVKHEPERFSLIHVPYSFVIPGGRFREFYYWDAYWIIRGLLASNMTETAKNMVLNFAHIVEQHGFIPNGGRIYYLKRSQPPLFAPMVYEYYEATRDIDLLKRVAPAIEKEIEFWKRERHTNVTFNGQHYTMFQYRTISNTPRPESYREDVITARSFLTIEEKRKYFQNIASAAESGWDFSSRWFADSRTLETIQITDILPVDLNAFICYNMRILSYIYGEIGQHDKRDDWSTAYRKFRDDFHDVFYVNKSHGWYDYNLVSKEHNVDYYPSNAVPLFTQCFDVLNTRMADEIYKTMLSKGVVNFPGLPMSLHDDTNQQWDYPNSWSPLNHMVVEGLRKSNNPEMQQKAVMLAQKWVDLNMKMYDVHGHMWEKYDVTGEIRLASGGEYKVQAGFGWSNAVIMDLLRTYGDRLEYNASSPLNAKFEAAEDYLDPEHLQTAYGMKRLTLSPMAITIYGLTLGILAIV